MPSSFATTTEDETVAGYAVTIGRSADHVSRMTRELRAFAGKSLLWPVTIEIGAFFAELEPALRAALGPRVVLAIGHAEPGALLSVDADRFREAVSNIVQRASDVMPTGGSLAITTRVDTAAGGPMIAIAFADTGRTMSRHELDTLFDPFLALGLGTRTGLELAMVHGLVRQSGGTIDVRSGAAGGTVIEVCLPDARSVPAQPTVLEAPPSGGPSA